MIDQGLVLLIQAGLGSPPIAPGGFAGQAPKDYVGTAYWYKIIAAKPDKGLQFTRGLTKRIYQFDCIGNNALDSLNLASALDVALRGFGNKKLPDPDQTFVSSISQEDWVGPVYSDTVRNFVTILQYEVWYAG